MIEAPLLDMQLRSLHLSTVLTNYHRLLGEHTEPLPYLSDLISLESAKRQENGVRTRIAAAHFPTIKTIESFDFALQPELPKAKLLEHFDGAFVDKDRAGKIWKGVIDRARPIQIARHVRSYDARQQIEDERHLKALTTEKHNAREHRGKNRLFAVCPTAKAFLGEIALHGGHLGGTTSRLLRLLDLYGAAVLDVAIHDAHERGAFRAESVAHVLDQRRRADGADDDG